MNEAIKRLIYDAILDWEEEHHILYDWKESYKTELMLELAHYIAEAIKDYSLDDLRDASI